EVAQDGVAPGAVEIDTGPLVGGNEVARIAAADGQVRHRRRNVAKNSRLRIDAVVGIAQGRRTVLVQADAVALDDDVVAGPEDDATAVVAGDGIGGNGQVAGAQCSHPGILAPLSRGAVADGVVAGDIRADPVAGYQVAAAELDIHPQITIAGDDI